MHSPFHLFRKARKEIENDLEYLGLRKRAETQPGVPTGKPVSKAQTQLDLLIDCIVNQDSRNLRKLLKLNKFHERVNDFDINNQSLLHVAAKENAVSFFNLRINLEIQVEEVEMESSSFEIEIVVCIDGMIVSRWIQVEICIFKFQLENWLVFRLNVWKYWSKLEPMSTQETISVIPPSISAVNCKFQLEFNLNFPRDHNRITLAMLANPKVDPNIINNGGSTPFHAFCSTCSSPSVLEKVLEISSWKFSSWKALWCICCAKDGFECTR